MLTIVTLLLPTYVSQSESECGLAKNRDRGFAAICITESMRMEWDMIYVCILCRHVLTPESGLAS